MKPGDLVQYKAYNTVLDTGYVLKYDNDPEMIWVEFVKLGSQRCRRDSIMTEVISEA